MVARSRVKGVVDVRDAQNDLKLCEKATPGPWEVVPDIRPGLAVKGYSSYRGDLGGYCGSGHLGTLSKYDNKFNDAVLVAESREALPYYIRQMLDAVGWLKHIRNNYDLDPVDDLMISKFLKGEEITEEEAERIVGGGQGD